MAKEKTPIIGNAKTLTFGDSQPQRQATPQVKDDKWIDDDSSEIPF